jgi:Zn2+/Cd2+-exporting ATPase
MRSTASASAVFDKTGTLTRGQLHLVGTHPQTNIMAASMLQLAASLGAASSHPVSRALSAQLPETHQMPITEERESGGSV